MPAGSVIVRITWAWVYPAAPRMGLAARPATLKGRARLVPLAFGAAQGALNALAEQPYAAD